MPKYRTRREAAKHLTELGLPVTYSTLTKLATVGGGPPYRLFGNKAVYTDDDLIAWAEAKMKPMRASSSEAA